MKERDQILQYIHDLPGELLPFVAPFFVAIPVNDCPSCYVGPNRLQPSAPKGVPPLELVSCAYCGKRHVLYALPDIYWQPSVWYVNSEGVEVESTPVCNECSAKVSVDEDFELLMPFAPPAILPEPVRVPDTEKEARIRERLLEVFNSFDDYTCGLFWYLFFRDPQKGSQVEKGSKSLPTFNVMKLLNVDKI